MTIIPMLTEEQEQAVLFQWSVYARNQYPELAYLFHIPNGGVRSKSEAARFKKTGVKPGIPDIFLPVARGDYHGLFIELKRENGGRVSPDQKAWLDALTAQGYRAEICRGADEAIETIKNYLITHNE